MHAIDGLQRFLCPCVIAGGAINVASWCLRASSYFSVARLRNPLPVSSPPITDRVFEGNRRQQNASSVQVLQGIVLPLPVFNLVIAAWLRTMWSRLDSPGIWR
jgi:Na+/melibiose symporter-like transporter